MESKCPCCSGARDMTCDKVGNEHFACDVCLFMCDIKDLPRIAAAMELARAMAKPGEIHGFRSSEKTGEKFRRVLEVFVGDN